MGNMVLFLLRESFSNGGTPSLGYKGWGLYGIALKIFEKIRDANPESFQAKGKNKGQP